MKRISIFSLGIAIVTLAMVSRSSSTGAAPVHEVEVEAKKFAFEPSTIQVAAGEPVRLMIRSADAVHGFAIRDLNVDIQIPQGGAAATVEFTAPPPGRYEITCSEFCGRGHAQMKATLVSVTTMRTAR
jgi:cytochrome c oxidase subunit II